MPSRQSDQFTHRYQSPYIVSLRIDLRLQALHFKPHRIMARTWPEFVENSAKKFNSPRLYTDSSDWFQYPTVKMSKERSDKISEPLDDTNTDTDEEQILESISRLSIEVNRIELTTGPSKRTHCMRTEIERLESQLAYFDSQAIDRTGQFSRNTP